MRFLPRRRADTPVTCAVCGCRLLPVDGAEATWRHIPSLDPRRDARGDRPECVDTLHDVDGYKLEGSTAASVAA
jgi:hypothetical protein